MEDDEVDIFSEMWLASGPKATKDDVGANDGAGPYPGWQKQVTKSDSGNLLDQ